MSVPKQPGQPPEGRKFPIPEGSREGRSCGESRKSTGVSRQESSTCEVGERTRTGRVWRREKAEQWPS